MKSLGLLDKPREIGGAPGKAGTVPAAPGRLITEKSQVLQEFVIWHDICI